MSIIVFKTVTQKFPDGTVAFSGLDFEIDEGEKVLITGPSGSGKTTIMRLLIGEYQPTQGEILFEDKPLLKTYRNRWHIHRRQVGVIFQDYKLIEELNVWENVALPLLIRGERQDTVEERVTDLLNLVELADKAYMFPRQLSGGEAQRISIARALANSPKVIFADEPTGNLDLDNTKHILKLLNKINELGTTLIMATHDPYIIEQLKTKRIDLAKKNVVIESKEPVKQDEKKEIAKEKEKQPEKEDKKDQQEKKEKKEKIEINNSENKKSSNRVSSFLGSVKKLFPKKRPKKIQLDDEKVDNEVKDEEKIEEDSSKEKINKEESKKNEII